MAKETREKAEIGPYETIERRRLGRRAFLKTGVYGLAGATAGDVYHKIMDFFGWGVRTAGNKAYKLDRAYDQKVEELKKSDKPVERAIGKTGEVAKKPHSWRSKKLWRPFFGRSEEDQSEWRERRKIGEHAPDYKPGSSTEVVPKTKPYTPQPAKPAPEVDRRGFLSRVLGLAHNNPRVAGGAIGLAVGGVKAARNYDPQGKTAAARGLDVQVAIAEKGNEATQENTDAVRGLTARLAEAQKPKRPDPRHHDEEYGGVGMFTVGIIGIILSVIISSVQITGFSIANASESSLKIGSIVIFLISLMLILISRFIK